MADHSTIDQRSIDLHRKIAEKIRNNPSLFSLAQKKLSEFITAGNSSLPYFIQWKEIFDSGLDFVLKEITKDTEKMRALRQSSPFTGILTPKERWSIYETYRN